MSGLVKLKSVSKIYDRSNPQPALDSVSISIEQGGITAIMGPSGSGKSTLLNIIAGLDRVSSGAVQVDGVELNRLSEAALARYRRTQIGLIFQFFNLLNNLTVLENVLIPAQLTGVKGRDARRRADELLETLGIEQQRRAYPATLSGGQRQRVAIARALINRPPLLLADEPTGALDRRSGEQVIDIFRDLCRTGQTILLVTHDARLAESCADRTITLVDGALAQDSANVTVSR
jgi:putative ABC transport system ATP-binding protein